MSFFFIWVCRWSVFVAWNGSSFPISQRAQEVWILSVFGCHFLRFGCPYIHLSVAMISPELAPAVILRQVLYSHCSPYGWKYVIQAEVYLSAICSPILNFNKLQLFGVCFPSSYRLVQLNQNFLAKHKNKWICRLYFFSLFWRSQAQTLALMNDSFPLL